MGSNNFTNDRVANAKGGYIAAGLLGLTVTTFGLGAFCASPDFLGNFSITDIIGAIAAMASTAAAVAAAYSAKFTRDGAEATRISASAGLSSAKATQETVSEMREARKDEQRPRLTIERKFLDLKFVCPGGLNNGPLYRSRTQYDPSIYSAPEFELTNQSDASAFDVSVQFRLEDNNGSFELSKSFNDLGVRIVPSPSLASEQPVEMAIFGAPLAGGVGLPLYRRMVEYRPFCGPRQTRLIEFPQGLLTTLFVRGLQYRDRQGSDSPLQPINLIVEIACYTVGKEKVETSFRFEANPFCYGPNAPLEAYSHFRELPSNPIHDQRAS
ncbi:hypothetical protein C8J42_101916 [Sphingomonas sp. PP-CE-1A-559]|uniref:hypothetical protein n=1 Tax=Sphingomonas sp. PP-CE-1A-559 TaxID=2135657 RepID=UPI001056174F|nr:hypothetical protein [Sphingomonas sp. PP-CE-1A-559]TCP94450.1 hypothetical protein C8J42_101916 [Sphingomonas sp. PP-CE-1A-559]